MYKTVVSYLIIDVLEAMTYRLSPVEYASRHDAEAALRHWQDLYPDCCVREEQHVYDLSRAEELNRYEAHIKRLQALGPAGEPLMLQPLIE
jgi:hypothetical protein